jgi:hypothetical protein
MGRAVGYMVVAMFVTACGADSPSPPADRRAAEFEYPAAPPAPDRPRDPGVESALDGLVRAFADSVVDPGALDRVARSGDPRHAWFVADLMRFVPGDEEQAALAEAFQRLTGVDPRLDPTFADSPWESVTNHLIAWDLPSPPRYRERKGDLFTVVEPGWEPFFADADAGVDWRILSWGGVFIDDRALGDPKGCSRGCIPALDDPALTDAGGGNWFPDDGTVFGVVVGSDAVAFPKNVMEVHEMVNITIGGRRLGIPYCTLCGSAQAYFTDSVPPGSEVPVLRTSGLLSRSNKVMYDLRTRSVFDTFTGEALSGPLQDAGVTLEQTSVVTSTWEEWRRAHPDTRIVAEDGGIGRSYPADPLRGRDEDGPIFPIGPVDPRLPVQAKVLGVIAPDGRPLAFPVDQTRAALGRGGEVLLDGVEVVADGSGLRARRPAGGADLPAHEAFWFAWSQFHPGTSVWVPRPGGALGVDARGAGR